MYYQPHWFKAYELVPKEMYEFLKAHNEPFQKLFDDRILRTADMLRETYGKMVCNTWWWGGTHQYRGWRPWDCEVGAALSQHKWGRAIDLVPVEYSVFAIRQDIRDNPHEETFKHITCMENAIPWLHNDTRAWNKEQYGILEITLKVGS